MALRLLPVTPSALGVNILIVGSGYEFLYEGGSVGSDRLARMYVLFFLQDGVKGNSS